MQSIRELTSGLTGALSSVGIDIGGFGNTDTEENKIVCFNSINGRYCEELPKSEEVKCNDKGVCSVFLTGIEKSNPIEEIAGEFGLKSFSQNSDGIVTKNLTGILERKDVEKLSERINKSINITESNQLRTITEGDILPPAICNLNPLSSKCEKYLISGNWFYMGPFKGWVKANGFFKALSKIKNPRKIAENRSFLQNDKKVMKG